MKELLLLLCRYPFEEKNRNILSKLIGEVSDWHSLVKLINDHGIIALAVYNLKEAGLTREIPAEAMTFLEKGYMLNVVRNTWLTERWKEINSILSSAGIKHILLKGMALEHTLYGARSLRQMNDNDVLINHEDAVKAWKLLQQQGFSLEPVKSPLFKKILFDLGQHLPTLYKNGYALEIHDKLTEPKSIAPMRNGDPFSDAIEISVDDTKALILSKEMHLKYLISHFEQHLTTGDCQLRLYTDIVLLDKSCSLEIPDRFIADPIQSAKKEFRKAAYKVRISSIPFRSRVWFILGDTFPSLKWMKDRYKCNWFKAILMYPLRIGKLKWLL